MEPEPSEPDLPAAARVSGDICICTHVCELLSWSCEWRKLKCLMFTGTLTVVEDGEEWRTRMVKKSQ